MTVPYAYQKNVEFAELLRGDVYPDGTVIPTSERIGIKFDGNAVSVYELDASTGVRVRKKIYDSAPGEFVPDEDEAASDLAKRLECMQNEIDELEEEEWDIRRRISELESEMRELRRRHVDLPR